VPGHDRIAQLSTLVIQQAGAAPPLIVVGHGSQCIFAGRPDGLHVFLHGPFEARVQRIVKRLHVDPARAPALVRRADFERPAYVQRYFHTDWRCAALYDLQFNRAKLSVADAVGIVERLVRDRMPAADGPRAGCAGPGGVPAG
jgi:cytidylate kinase